MTEAPISKSYFHIHEMFVTGEEREDSGNRRFGGENHTGNEFPGLILELKTSSEASSVTSFFKKHRRKSCVKRPQRIPSV